MRILSQDGMIDVPYEQVVIQKFKEKIYFLNKNLTGIEELVDDIALAEYPTEAKAKRAMEMLHDAYMAYAMYETMSEQQRALFLVSANDKEQENLYGVFKFPADDELEG